MSKTTLSAAQLAETLHPVFDQQIINYGAYNLVFATGTAVYRNPDIAEQQLSPQEHFLIGYRESPNEIVIAPLLLPKVSPAGTPTSIDNTNAMRAYALNEVSFGIESTNGSSFVLPLEPSLLVETEAGSGILEQQADVEDLQYFLVTSWFGDDQEISA